MSDKVLEKLDYIERKLEVFFDNYIKYLPEEQREELEERLQLLEDMEWERRMGDDL